MIIRLLLATLAFPFLAQAQSLEKCAWSAFTEKTFVDLSSADNLVISEDLKECSALNKYLESLANEANIKKSVYGTFLLGAAQEKVSAFRVLWILDQYRDSYVNASKTAKYSAVLDLFEKGMIAYFEKLDELNKKHVAALTSSDPKDVLDWQYLGQIYQDEVSLASSNWISSGYKNETYQLAEKAQQKK